MRAASKVVALSSLLVAASVAAGPSPKNKPTDKTSAAKAGAPAGASSTPSGAPAGTSADGTAAGDGSAPPPAPPPDLSAVKPEDMPTAVRMRRLEQKTQALKERAWQLKARVQMLKEQMIGGGVGAQAVIAHNNEMGASFRLVKLVYALDGTQVFARTDDTAESLYKARSFDVFAGPISPGNHNISAVATYRGHGYGVFEYLSKYTFTARGNQAFIAGAGKISKVDCRGFEKGGPTMPLEKRASVECKVTQVQPEKSEKSDKPADKAADKPDAAGRPTAPAPAGSPAAPASAPAAAPSPAPAAPTPGPGTGTPPPAPATRPTPPSQPGK